MALRDPFEPKDYQALAEQYDQRARKDATLNMRVSSQQLELIKKAAALKGFPKYQKWVDQVLASAIAEALGIDDKLEDDF